ncbi:MAG: peptide deformylase [Deltaproteobacteria bacterium]|nr:peptide deformylase [Deltaproteobacteria bacterium]
MAVLNICTYPDPVLKQKALPIEKIDDALQDLIRNMVDTMYQAPGIGLAANQVGRPLRLIVFDVTPKDQPRNPRVLINPEIVCAEGSQSLEEGCLSVPEFYSEVKRCSKVTVRGLDTQGNPVELEGEGLLAVVLQHEIDHLDGILMLDRISPLKRALYKKRRQKQLKSKDETG